MFSFQKGDLPPEMRRRDPLRGSIMQKFQLALKLRDMPSLINDFRLAAHTAQLGKSKGQCIGEFKDRVIKLYGEFNLKLPEIRPIPTMPDIEAPSEPKLESIGTLGGNVNGFISPGDRSDETSYYTADGNLYVASDENIPCRGEATGSQEANSCMHVYFPGERVETKHENLLEGTTALSPPGSPQPPKLFSKEWWLTPEKGIAAIGGAVATTVLLGWGFLLWKKWGQWRQRKVQQGKLYKRRIHARSWTVRE